MDDQLLVERLRATLQPEISAADRDLITSALVLADSPRISGSLVGPALLVVVVALVAALRITGSGQPGQAGAGAQVSTSTNGNSVQLLQGSPPTVVATADAGDRSIAVWQAVCSPGTSLADYVVLFGRVKPASRPLLLRGLGNIAVAPAQDGSFVVAVPRSSVGAGTRWFLDVGGSPAAEGNVAVFGTRDTLPKSPEPSFRGCVVFDPSSAK